MPAVYTFSTVLLSSDKTGNPKLIGTSLSASGVNTIYLGSDVSGIAFNIASTTPSGSLINLSLSGCLFRIDMVYSGATMALVLTNGLYTTFTFNSAFTTVPLSALGETTDSASTPNTRRKWLYGYI